jgi:hypothetical protein
MGRRYIVRSLKIAALLILVSGLAYGQSPVGKFSRYVQSDTLIAFSDSSFLKFQGDSIWFFRTRGATGVNLMRTSGAATSFDWSVTGSAVKNDSVRFIQGTNVTLTQSNNTITIAATAGAYDLRIRESDGAPTVGSVDSIDVNASNLVITNPSGNRAVINTIQNIGTTASPTFGTPTLDGITPSSSDFILNLGLPYSVLWIDGDNFLKPIALGVAGTVLTSNSESSAPSFAAAGDSVRASHFADTLRNATYLKSVDSATAFLSIGDAVAAYLPIGQRPKFSVTGSAAVNDSIRFTPSTGIAISNSANVFTVTGTDTTSLSNRINAKGDGDITGVTAGDGIQAGGASGTVTVDASPDFDGGLETVDDSLNIKLYGTTLTKDASGLRADTAILATQYDLTQIGSLGVTQQTELFEDFLSANGVGNTGWIQTTIAGGTSANIAPVDTSRSGVLSLTTGTTAGISSGGVNYGTVSFSTGGGELLFEASVRLPTLSTSSQYKVSIGFMDAPSTALNIDGVYFVYSDSSSGKWICVSDSANSASPVRETRTVTDSIVAAGRWYKLSAVINATGSSVGYFINGTLVATHTTKIPRWFSAGVPHAFAPTIKIVEITSDNTTNTMYVDYYYLRRTYTAVR